MTKITAWKAKRSGAFMTVIGKTARGDEIRVSEITSIEIAGGPAAHVMAVTRAGHTYELAAA